MTEGKNRDKRVRLRMIYPLESVRCVGVPFGSVDVPRDESSHSERDGKPAVSDEPQKYPIHCIRMILMKQMIKQ